MKIDDIRNISVIGAGLMGHGIALEYAIAGYNVTINDINDEALDVAWSRIRESADLMQTFNLLDANTAESAMGRIHADSNLDSAAAEADLVVEAMTEDLEKKNAVYRQIDARPYSVEQCHG
ncbi:MAG: 3-hydroxyacyl-CoA dehydrogenase NAD-binding domain-containing protein [Verrucomicrobiota bacterium]